MLQPIDSESNFASNLEAFISKANQYLHLYHQGVASDADFYVVACKIQHLTDDADNHQSRIKRDLALAEAEQLQADRQDLEADYYDSAWC